MHHHSPTPFTHVLIRKALVPGNDGTNEQPNLLCGWLQRRILWETNHTPIFVSLGCEIRLPFLPYGREGTEKTTKANGKLIQEEEM